MDLLLDEWLMTSWGLVMKYLLVAGLAYLLCYIILKKVLIGRKIQKKLPKPADYQREIGYSVLAMLIMTASAALNATVLLPYNNVYFGIDTYGWGYYLFSFVWMIALHDTYFYWMHRTIHHPRLFRTFHLVHHRSTNPSPWAAYAFHPLEAILEGAILPIIAFTLPIHWSAMVMFFIFSVVHDVYIHLGYEILPSRFHQTRVGRWINTSVAHNQHHRHFGGNFGLYFTCWDRWMGTLRSDYDEAYTKATPQRTVLDAATVTTPSVSGPSGGL
ncbi:ERG3 [Fibrisoma limi BUZ 3]|uniref:ERG3 protein n=1 Tax=Fibrisoma limi BUZ 3 TaxID=1185876 RepID=I2GN57_9BACT|nr:sterol desaturase family protein [Fibrisoma limi]CCH55335.1 ERG3 [Fibrisoma limi BUZ 3]